jgi:hypothetical protein
LLPPPLWACRADDDSPVRSHGLDSATMIAFVAPDDKLEAFFDRVARLSDAVYLSRRIPDRRVGHPWVTGCLGDPRSRRPASRSR